MLVHLVNKWIEPKEELRRKLIWLVPKIKMCDDRMNKSNAQLKCIFNGDRNKKKQKKTIPETQEMEPRASRGPKSDKCIPIITLHATLELSAAEIIGFPFRLFGSL